MLNVFAAKMDELIVAKQCMQLNAAQIIQTQITLELLGDIRVVFKNVKFEL